VGTREIVLSVVVPGFVSGVVMLGLALVWRRRLKTQRGAGDAGSGVTPSDGPFWAVPLLVTGAVVLGAYAWQTDVSLWPDSVTHRFPVIALAALAAALPALIAPVAARLVACGLVGAGVGVFGAWAFLGELHESLISESARAIWIAAAGGVCGLTAVGLESVGGALRGWRGPLLLWGAVRDGGARRDGRLCQRAAHPRRRRRGHGPRGTGRRAAARGQTSCAGRARRWPC
jgi:hypothetical protein